MSTLTSYKLLIVCKAKNMLHTNRVVENSYDSEHTRMSESSAASVLTVSYSATFPGLYALFHRCFPFQRHSIILSRSLPVAKVSAYNHQSYWLMCHVSFRKTLSLLTPDYNVSLLKTKIPITQKTQPSPLEQKAAECCTGKWLFIVGIIRNA
jgi:hypothetical protein